MLSHRAVVVHGLAHAIAALRPGRPTLLLSAPEAAGHAGCLWWRELAQAARAACPATPCQDALDCGAAPGLAMAALRAGLTLLILSPDCPAFAAVQAAARAQGAVVLPARPPALDLATRGAARRLDGWLAGGEP